MSRSAGAVDAVRTAVPEEAALLFGLLTQLGDVWFLVTIVLLAYWLRPGDRERTAVVAAVAIATMAVVEGLKAYFQLPRPPTPLATPDAFPAVLRWLVEGTATAGGHGFPSGHATLTTAVALGLAGAVRLGSPRRRMGLAIGLITVVSLTRVALGVHFLVDVLAGVLVGLAVLAGTGLAVRSAPTRGPTTAFGVAVVAALVGLAGATASIDPGDAAVVPVAHDPFLALAVAVGAFAGWQAYLYDDERTGPDRETAPSPLRPEERREGETATVRRSTARGLFALGAGLALLALGLAGLIVGDGTAALGGAAGLTAALAVALPALVPGFDATLGGYVPGWLRGPSGDVEG